MDWSTRINMVLAWMDARLAEGAGVAESAAHAGMSKSAFERTFQILVGMGPGEYLRRRRLSAAARDLAAGTSTMTDIAFRYGWQSTEAFSRAFRKAFGTGPAEAVRPGTTLELFPAMRVLLVHEGGTIMKYRMVDDPGFTAAGLVMEARRSRDMEQGRLGPGSLARFWLDTRASGMEALLRQRRGPRGLLGISWGWEHVEVDDVAYKYMIGVEMPAGGLAVLPPGSVALTLAPSRYAVFEGQGRMPGPIDEIWRVFSHEWYPGSGYEHTGGANMEAFPPFDDARSDHESPLCQVEVWIPLKSRA